MWECVRKASFLFAYLPPKQTGVRETSLKEQEMKKQGKQAEHMLLVKKFGKGAALKPEHRKCDRKRTAGRMFQVYIPAVLHIVGLPYVGIFELYQTAPQRRSELIQKEVLSTL
ncbi:hypothetical protein JOQ06_020750 [Pogonophryne albipinna]|uniref:Uncharacterized protein n=1 Tax=Pogonophryne albipinna TaxID=1090488 RepID=A0AAD6FWJ7_9TELE|nr:hypothetical protein JOQ06_020750 [Pogonophryne albipinna]